MMSASSSCRGVLAACLLAVIASGCSAILDFNFKQEQKDAQAPDTSSDLPIDARSDQRSADQGVDSRPDLAKDQAADRSPDRAVDLLAMDLRPQDDVGPDSAVDLPPPDLAPDGPFVVPGNPVTINAAGKSFMMGSPGGELCQLSGQTEALHQVTLTRSFEMQSTEVTQLMFKSLMGYNNANNATCLTCPVEQVSWHEAAAYCNQLSINAGLAPCYACTSTNDAGVGTTCSEVQAYEKSAIYSCPGWRLPTEAEWEFAARGGTQTAYYNGDVPPAEPTPCVSNSIASAAGWYSPGANGQTHPPGQKAVNGYGLYDMLGNVGEWTNDRWLATLGIAPVTDPWGADITTTARVWRGGNWTSQAGDLRAAWRGNLQPDQRYFEVGFRCVRSQ
jgi:sulfatase modifying factor 1